jgi:hypothetical protein
VTAWSDAHGNTLEDIAVTADSHGNTLEDIMAYAIVGSLDADRFNEILSEHASYDVKERLQGYGPHQKMMYNIMENHFKQRAAQPPPIAPEKDEAGARAGSARAAGKVTASASAGATSQIKRLFVDDQFRPVRIGGSGGQGPAEMPGAG